MAKELQHVAELSPSERAALVSRLKQQRAAERDAQALVCRGAGVQHPLSFAQQRLWFLEQLEPDGPYKVPAAFRLRGPLQVAALEQSVNEIINRHEVLRTTFAEIDGQPVQIVAPRLTLSIPVQDLTGLPELERAERLKQTAARLREQPFDFTRGPLVGAALLRLNEDEYHFWFLMHHIVSDGWSIGVFLKELSAAYEAFVAGREPELPELPIQYADFAVWQRAWLQGERLDRQMKYWQERLGTNAPTLELPTDRPRPPVQGYRGASLTHLIDLELTTRLKALARRESVTPYMFLLAVFKTLLARYSRQHDIVVGTPVANRNRTELEPLIGFFVNTLVLRTDLSGDPTFRELLGRVRDVTLGAFAHQDVPFEKLVEELQPERDTSRTPLFQVMFSLQNAPLPPLKMGDIEISLLDDETEVSLFDLSFDVMERADGLLCTLEYNTDLFDAATVTRMLKHFTVLLDAVVTDPSASISALPLLTDDEQRQVFKWNETRRDFPLNRCVHELFEDQAARTPEAIALVCGGERLTYAELNARANRLARHLRACGVEAETRVGILLDREASAGVALLGVLKAGGAWLALDPEYPPPRLAFMLEDAEASVLVTTTQLAASLPAHGARVVCLDAEAHEIESHAADNLGPVASSDNLAYLVYTSGTTGRPKGTLVEHRSLVNTSLAFAAQHHLTPRDRILQFASLSFDVAAEEFFGAWLSGARAVMRPVPVFDTVGEFVGFVEREGVTVANLPTSFWAEWLSAIEDQRRVDDGETHGALLPATLRGEDDETHNALPPETLQSNYSETHNTLPPETLQSDDGETHNSLLPSMLRTDDGETHNSLLPSTLRRVVVGNEKTLSTTVESWLRLVGSRVEWSNAYGPTETTVTASNYEPFEAPAGSAAHLRTHAAPIGRPIANAELYVLDARQQFVPVGVIGEIYIGGAGVARGYHRRAALTAERFLPHPYAHGARLYRTGDLGRFLPDGNIEFLGRADEQIKVRGFRVEVGEIEAVLRQHPDVREGAVVACDDEHRGVRLVAYVVPRKPEAELNDLRDYLRAQLPEYMVPSAVVRLEAFPLTPNGKLDRKALPSPNGTAAAANEPYVAPRSELEHLIADVWREALGVEQVGVRDNFFNLGGHSLLLIRVNNRLRETLRKELPVVELFKYPTVSALAEHLSRSHTPASAAPRAGRTEAESRTAALTRQRELRRRGEMQRRQATRSSRAAGRHD